jgi:hypothetical protein
MVVVVTTIAFGISEIGGFGKAVISDVSGWFSPPKITTQVPSSQTPSGTGKCIISGGTNNGTQVQNCP